VWEIRSYCPNLPSYSSLGMCCFHVRVSETGSGVLLFP
jgi:hypothetical protein